MKKIVREELEILNKNKDSLYGFESRSFITLLVYLFLLLFTILLLSLRIDTEKSFEYKNVINTIFSKSFKNFYSENEVYQFLKTTVGSSLLENDTGTSSTKNPYLQKLTKFVGPIVIKQTRTK